MTEQESRTILFENMSLFEEFLESDQYQDFLQLRKEDEQIHNLLNEMATRWDTVKFFMKIKNTHPRAIQESHLLADLVVRVMGYE